MRAAWESLLGIESHKDRLLAWAVTALRFGTIDSYESGLGRLALLTGPPGVGKTTMATSLGAPLTELLERDVATIRVNAHALVSSGHGETEQAVSRLMTDEIPSAAADRPAVVVFDEMETFATPREKVSLEANPVDVLRSTDAFITGADRLADDARNVVMVATTNFPELIDSALRSRADMVLTLPCPDATAATRILESTLAAMSKEIREFKSLAESPELAEVGALLAAAGLDARQVRKFVGLTLTTDLDLARDPTTLTIEHLAAAAAVRGNS